MELVLTAICFSLLGITIICYGQLKRIRRLENAIQFLAQKALDRIDGKGLRIHVDENQQAKVIRDRDLLRKMAGHD